jgi:predicted phosphoribosyltransferase
MHSLLRSPELHATIDIELLSRKLWPYRNTNTVIAATTARAEPLASLLGSELGLPFHLHYCKSIRHPGHANKSIGSLTANEIVLHDNAAQLPQGYVEHQIILIKHLLETPVHAEGKELRGKSIIILREHISEEDQVLAVVEELRKLSVSSIIIATPVISRTVLLELEKLADQVVYLEESRQPSSLASHESQEKKKPEGDEVIFRMKEKKIKTHYRKP